MEGIDDEVRVQNYSSKDTTDEKAKEEIDGIVNRSRDSCYKVERGSMLEGSAETFSASLQVVCTWDRIVRGCEDLPPLAENVCMPAT